MSIWHVLNIECTKDVRAIKRAYASQAKQCHPDDAPEQFLQLRAAYKRALEYAQGNGAAGTGASSFSPLSGKEIQSQFFQPNTPTVNPSDEQITIESDSLVRLSESTERLDFNLIFHRAEQNRIELMLEQGVLRTVLTILADNKQRNNKQVWHDFIFSSEFLQAQLNDDFLQLLVYCISQKSGIPAAQLPRNMYIYLLLAFNAVTDDNNADMPAYVAPLIEVMQQHPHYAYIDKDIRRKELNFIRRGFALYNDVLKLYARSRLQPMESAWYSLLNRLESNLHTRGGGETYLLLAFFVNCNPDLPDYIYKIMYKVFDLGSYHQSSRKQSLKPLYEALQGYRDDFMAEIVREENLGVLRRQLFFAFRHIWLQYKDADATFHFEIETLPEAEQLFTSELFLSVQFEARTLYYFREFFGIRSSYIALGLSNAIFRAYQHYEDKKEVAELFQSINRYLGRAQSQRDVDNQHREDENSHIEVEQEQAAPLILAQDNEIELELEKQESQLRPLPENGILRTLLDALADEKLRNSKEFWHDFILSEPFLSQYHGGEFLAEIIYWLKRQTALPPRQLPRNMYLFLSVAFCPRPQGYTLSGYAEGIDSQPDLTPLKRLMRLHAEYSLFANDLKQPELEELQKAFYIYNSAQTLYIEQGFSPVDIWERLFDSVCGSEDCLCNAYLFRLLATFVCLHPDMPVDIYKIMHRKFKLDRYHTSRRKQILKAFYDSLAAYRRLYVSDAEKKHLEMLNKQFKKQFNKAFSAIYASYSALNEANLPQTLRLDDVDALFGSEMFRSIQFDSQVIADLSHIFAKKDGYIALGLWSAVYYSYQPYSNTQQIADLLKVLQDYRNR